MFSTRLGSNKEHNRDTACYSVIDTEWNSIKSKYEKWLAADNFDESGKQITKLQVF